MLDVARPLINLLEGLNIGALSSYEVKMGVTDTLQLLGNVVSQTSKIRRKRILKTWNPDIANLADKQELFQDAAPNLFGDGFELKMKE